MKVIITKRQKIYKILDRMNKQCGCIKMLNNKKYMQDIECKDCDHCIQRIIDKEFREFDV